jgi:hypothetical protein
LLCVVAFANALPTELVYDAVRMVQENPLLREESPWWKLLVTDYWAHYWYSGAYRPLSTVPQSPELTAAAARPTLREPRGPPTVGRRDRVSARSRSSPGRAAP